MKTISDEACRTMEDVAMRMTRKRVYALRNTPLGIVHIETSVGMGVLTRTRIPEAIDDAWNYQHGGRPATET